MSEHPLAEISKRPKKWMQKASQEMKAHGTEGKFTQYAKAHGMGVQEAAAAKYHAAGKLGKEARYAYMAGHRR